MVKLDPREYCMSPRLKQCRSAMSRIPHCSFIKGLAMPRGVVEGGAQGSGVPPTPFKWSFNAHCLHSVITVRQ